MEIFALIVKSSSKYDIIWLILNGNKDIYIKQIFF